LWGNQKRKEIMTNYVAYYRVSTQKQGQSGLGLEAQRAGVTAFISDNGNFIGEFTDIESGSKKNRLGLQGAIAAAKANNATIIAFRLDRLLRSLAILVELDESRVRFTALDALGDSEMIIEIKSSFAREELRKVSNRTKNALAALKARHGTVHHVSGSRKGGPSPEALQKAVAAIKEKAAANQFTRPARELAKSLFEAGKTQTQILASLKRGGFFTARKKPYTQQSQVARLLAN